jgi:hypothetical protein
MAKSSPAGQLLIRVTVLISDGSAQHVPMPQCVLNGINQRDESKSDAKRTAKQKPRQLIRCPLVDHDESCDRHDRVSDNFHWRRHISHLCRPLSRRAQTAPQKLGLRFSSSSRSHKFTGTLNGLGFRKADENRSGIHLFHFRTAFARRGKGSPAFIGDFSFNFATARF